MQSIQRDIKQMFNTSHMVNKLIIVILIASVSYFLVSIFAKGVVYKFNIDDYFFLGSDLMEVLKHPWVVISHLFIARSLYEMIWLLVLLYWFGSILGDLIGDDKILPVYLFSGIFGSVIFLLFTNLLKLDYFYVSGLESSVIGVMVSAAVLVPDYSFNLVVFGKIRIKYLVVSVIIIDLLFLYASSRYQYFALPGAIIAGWYYILTIRAGRGLNVPINLAIKKIEDFGLIILGRKKTNLKLEHRNAEFFKTTENKEKVDLKRLNKLLDRINNEGYDKLTEEEKKFLVNIGKGK
jgi:membrane associated rhomboid family serine protease